ncbi:J domain-containing protein [Candidatus Dependentiae bacterium]|nr:J domain-containing protein [Candidatus Dependentiae bacterium]MBU4387219.1 J domain-containing protein [Candidatus Dependentiae bacterium]MCG2756008.1 J domain-containing protein [Candidatus Dependentiae bacterium]
MKLFKSLILLLILGLFPTREIKTNISLDQRNVKISVALGLFAISLARFYLANYIEFADENETKKASFKKTKMFYLFLDSVVSGVRLTHGSLLEIGILLNNSIFFLIDQFDREINNLNQNDKDSLEKREDLKKDISQNKKDMIKVIKKLLLVTDMFFFLAELSEKERQDEKMLAFTGSFINTLSRCVDVESYNVNLVAAFMESVIFVLSTASYWKYFFNKNKFNNNYDNKKTYNTSNENDSLIKQARLLTLLDVYRLILNLPDDSSKEIINKKIKYLTLKIHPDKVKKEDKLIATKAFAALNSVKEYLDGGAFNRRLVEDIEVRRFFVKINNQILNELRTKYKKEEI